MSHKKIKTCPNCLRKKRNLWDFEGEEICEDCLDLKIFDKTLRDDLLKDSNVRIVAMEHGVFTEKTPNLRVYLATMQAMNWLLTQDLTGTNLVKLDDLKGIVHGYAADLEKDVIPVLQKVELLSDIKEKEETILGKKTKNNYISPGILFEEISKRWKGKQKDQAIYLLHGLVSSGTLSETPYFSGIRDTFVNSIIDELIDITDGEIDETKEYYEIEGYNCRECGRSYGKHQKDQLEKHLIDKHIIPDEELVKHIEPKQQLKGYLVPQSQFESYARRKNMQIKNFIDKLYTFLRYKFIFYEEEPTINRGGETYWIVKPEWVKTLSKTKINVKDHIKTLEKERTKSL
ncbi:MAG: hypothetical protein ACFFCV_07030 [Promethearchaeota archaeon]